MRGRPLALSGGKKFPPLLFIRTMTRKTLSIFVDESGKLLYPDSQSRFYIVGMVFHDQAFDVSDLIAKLDVDWRRMGLSDFCFHAGPLIRREKGCRFMFREQRKAIFSRMMLFARQMRFSYHCLVVDKKFVTSSSQIVERLQRQLSDFLGSGAPFFRDFDMMKVYYDCGQAPITRLLHDTFSEWLGDKVVFAAAVRPENYKLFQLADLICSIKLIESKLAIGESLTIGESRFFRGPRTFKHDILRRIKAKELTAGILHKY